MPTSKEDFECRHFKPMDDGFCSGIYVRTFDRVYTMLGEEVEIPKWYIAEECLRCSKLSSKVRKYVERC